MNALDVLRELVEAKDAQDASWRDYNRTQDEDEVTSEILIEMEDAEERLEKAWEQARKAIEEKESNGR